MLEAEAAAVKAWGWAAALFGGLGLLGLGVLAAAPLRLEDFARGLPSSGRRIAEAILEAAKAHGLDPWVLAGVIGRESGFGLYLDADGLGDGGHGHGLSQIDDRTWGAWLEANDWKDPRTNIMKGAEILAMELQRFGGNLEAALAAYNAGPLRVQQALRAGRHPDTVTTKQNYSTDVLRRAREFKALASA